MKPIFLFATLFLCVLAYADSALAGKSVAAKEKTVEISAVVTTNGLEPASFDVPAAADIMRQLLHEARVAAEGAGQVKQIIGEDQAEAGSLEDLVLKNRPSVKKGPRRLEVCFDRREEFRVGLPAEHPFRIHSP